MRTWLIRLTCCTLFSGSLLAQSAPEKSADPSKAIIILDASGSMWGKVEGRAKIEIAREVIRDFVSDLPENTELGLVVYGHRKKGDCNDIELLIEPKKVLKNEFVQVVNAIQPKGMTPLTASVEFAADILKFSEQKASVILITDGEETCDRDPCDAATRLEAEGVDFTAHVIAFDLADKAAQSVKCLASKTGGEFLRANDAKSLKSALDTAIQASAKPQNLSLKAPAFAKIHSEIVVKWDTNQKLQAFFTLVPTDSDAKEVGTKTPVPVDHQIKLLTPDKVGAHEVRMIDEQSQEIIARAPVQLYVNDIKLEAPSEATIGSEIPVKWSGTGHEQDYIAITPKNSPEDQQPKTWQYTKNESPVILQAPSTPGALEIRYHYHGTKEVFARVDIEIKESNITLEAKEKAASGSFVQVNWTGTSNKSDIIAIVPKDTPDEKLGKYEYTRENSSVKVEAPLFVGDAEIRYYNGQDRKVLARKPITLTPFEIALEAPESVVAGAKVLIKFDGPNNQNDIITITPKEFADEKRGKYEYTRDNDSVHVVAPLKLGEAEIRYIAGQNGKVLARRAIQITEAEIGFDVPKSAPSGSQVKVDFKAPNNPNDRITIVPKNFEDDKLGNYQYTRDDSSVKVVAPLFIGEAEIRYLSGQDGSVLARHPIELTSFEIQFDAPSSAISGSTVKVDFNGPNNPNDRITIVPKNFEDDKLGNYKYTRDDSSVKVVTPLFVGKAEIRYLSGQSKKILHRQDIELTELKIILYAPDSVSAGERFEVSWEGLSNEQDLIAIVPKGAPDDKAEHYEYARENTSVKLEALKEAGEAEIRFLSRQDRKVLARRPIQVTPAK